MNYEEFLPKLWALKLYDSIRTNDGEVYAKSFYDKQYDICKKKIIDPKEFPCNAIKKLLSRKKCSYCNKELHFKTFSDGDHPVPEFEDRGVLWSFPCCTSCNSSKGKMDMIYWWVVHKKWNFSDISTSVVGIFCRAKFRDLQNKNKERIEIPEFYYIVITQMEESLKISKRNNGKWI